VPFPCRDRSDTSENSKIGVLLRINSSLESMPDSMRREGAFLFKLRGDRTLFCNFAVRECIQLPRSSHLRVCLLKDSVSSMLCNR
jgi:hypothetical protein